MSVNNNKLSLELPSHFSNMATHPETSLSKNSKSEQLFDSSLRIGNQSTKTLTHYNGSSSQRDLSI